MAYAMPLNSSARSCVPADLLQLISVDYRSHQGFSHGDAL